MKRRTVLAAFFAVVLVVATAPTAKAIDIHNCAPANIMIEFYNESDRIELVYKKRIDIAAGGTVANVRIPGNGTHKAKIFNVSAGKRHLATYRAINGNVSYVLVADATGMIAMVTGDGC